jgi:hypothetical protein
MASPLIIDGAVSFKNSPIDGDLFTGADAEPVANLHPCIQTTEIAGDSLRSGEQ